jgi:hypothetical protein
MLVQPIVSTLLLHKNCPQRDERFTFSMCADWARSLVAQNLNGVLLLSGIAPAGEMPCVPNVVVIRVETFYPDWEILQHWNAIDARWILYHYLLSRANFDAAFFTDVTDVVVRNNPFPHIAASTLYCGDEVGQPSGENTVSHPWLRDLAHSRGTPAMARLFDEQPDLPLLNCGVVGGKRAVLFDFFRVLMLAGLRQDEKTVDMAFFNYALYSGLFPHRVVHGPPVTSVYKQYQNRDDVWFNHK